MTDKFGNLEVSVLRALESGGVERVGSVHADAGNGGGGRANHQSVSPHDRGLLQRPAHSLPDRALFIEDRYIWLHRNGVVSSAFGDSNWCEKKQGALHGSGSEGRVDSPFFSFFVSLLLLFICLFRATSLAALLTAALACRLLQFFRVHWSNSTTVCGPSAVIHPEPSALSASTV